MVAPVERTLPFIWRRPVRVHSDGTGEKGDRRVLWVGGKSRVPRSQQDKVLTAWGNHEAGDRALLYGRSARAKVLPPAPRNAAAVLIRSLRGSWRPQGPLDALPGCHPPTPPAQLAGRESVSRCQRHARCSLRFEGNLRCRCCASAGRAGVPEAHLRPSAAFHRPPDPPQPSSRPTPPRPAWLRLDRSPHPWYPRS